MCAHQRFLAQVGPPYLENANTNLSELVIYRCTLSYEPHRCARRRNTVQRPQYRGYVFGRGSIDRSDGNRTDQHVLSRQYSYSSMHRHGRPRTAVHVCANSMRPDILAVLVPLCSHCMRRAKPTPGYYKTVPRCVIVHLMLCLCLWLSLARP